MPAVLNSYCATFSLAIVWPAGRETHKSLPSLSHRKSDQATPLQTFQQHPPHHQRTLKPRLRDRINGCHEWESRVKSQTTAVSVFPPKFSLCLLASGLIYTGQRQWQTGLCQTTKICDKTSDIKPYQSKQPYLQVPEIGGGSRWVSSWLVQVSEWA